MTGWHEIVIRNFISLHNRQVAIAAISEGKLIEKVAVPMAAEKKVRIDRAEEILKSV